MAILKNQITETMGRIELNENLLKNAKADFQKRLDNKEFGMTTNELGGSIEYYEDQIATDRPALERMRQEYERLQNK